MAGNTIMTAKNSFSEGLLMDFAPDNTQANCMTSALNATLLTFNGNEMSLLNDMGNGRVETAYLPDGYVPVGTCEFGDIIYIISYNPLLDKSLIGCFPSPERNISSEELGLDPLIITGAEFQYLDGNIPTGELKTSSVKKILFLNDMHPGDQYIIYSENTNWGLYISDYGNSSNMKGTFPKFVKINIVSVEESGKITYLDSNVKWYDNDYYILDNMKPTNTGKLDLDSYRNMVSSAYSTFSSKISGKLSLLIELEKITGFGCSWECYIPEYVYYGWIRVSETLYESISDFITNSTLRGPSNILRDFKANPENYPWVWTLKLNPDVNNKNVVITESIKILDCETINHNSPDNILEYVKSGTVINNKLVKYNYIRVGNEIYINSDKTCQVLNGKIENNILYKDYTVKFNFNWSTDNKNINPKYVVVDKFNWNSSDKFEYYDDNLAKRQGTFKELPVLVGDFFTFSLLYDPSVYTGTYLSFINSDCYEKKSENLLNEILSNYYNKTIDNIKTNFDSSSGLPIPGSYYVNINDITDGNIYHLDSSGSRVKSTPHDISDDIINNSLKLPVEKLLHGNITLPVEGIVENTKYQLDRTNLILDYTVVPAMAYGMLREYSISGQIDFSKIGTTNIKLKKWKYYNYENSITLTWGMDAYTEPDKGIPEVVFEFYDSSGLAAAYHVKNYSSYNGTFNEYIVTNSLSATPNLNNIDWNGNEFFHLKRTLSPSEIQYENQYYYKDSGEYLKINSLYFYQDSGTGKMEVNINEHDFSRPCYIKINEKEYTITKDSKFYESDAGMLYNNWLYAVKIIVRYENKNILGEYIKNENPIIDSRWLWTNELFNEHYSSVDDYIDLKFSLNLDVDVKYSTTNEWQVHKYNYKSPETGKETVLDYEKQAAVVQYINTDGNLKNLKITLNPGLVNNYNTFTLCSQKYDQGEIKYPLKDIYAEIILGEQTIQNYPELVDVLSNSGTPFNLLKSLLQPTFDHEFKGAPEFMGNKLIEEVGRPPWVTQNPTVELYEASGDYLNLENSFCIRNKDHINLKINENTIKPIKTGLSRFKILQF